MSVSASGATNQNMLQAQQATVPVHQHIMSLTTSPYGDNPIFKDLKPTSALNEEALKPTNPAAQKAILESSSQYKVSPKLTNGLRIKPVSSTLSKVISTHLISTTNPHGHYTNLLNFHRNHCSAVWRSSTARSRKALASNQMLSVSSSSRKLRPATTQGHQSMRQ